ncbi:MAG: GYF domain-containing protein [bacterium]
MGLIVALIFGVGCALIAHNKGRSPVGWFFIGFLLTFIGLILALVVSDKIREKQREQNLQREQQRLREQLKQERMKNRAFQKHAQARLDKHDDALKLNTRQIVRQNDRTAPLIAEKSARAFVDNPGGGSAAAFDSGWYVQQAGENRGPLSRTDLCRLHSYNELDSESLVWHPSLEDWNPLRNVRETLGIESIS